MGNQIENITKEMEMYDIQLKEIKPYIEKIYSFEKKVSCIENKMKSEIAELSKQSEEASKGIETNNTNFLTIETKVNEAKDDIGRVNRDVVQQKEHIEVMAKQNATQILETKNEINIKKDIVVKRVEELKIEFEVIKTTQVLESSKSEKMEEKLGEVVNNCQSFDQRITSLEEVSSEQSRHVKASENSSKQVLELVENEIKADIRNSKDELRKQRISMDSRNNNFHSLLLEFYLIFRCSTLVLQSSGGVADMYRDLLGVYRVVGDNVYKQEGGESYV